MDFLAIINYVKSSYKIVNNIIYQFFLKDVDHYKISLLLHLYQKIY